MTKSLTYNTHIWKARKIAQKQERMGVPITVREREIMSNIKKNENKQTTKTGKAITHDSDNLHTRRC